jgi:hypothetical protein
MMKNEAQIANFTYPPAVVFDGHLSAQNRYKSG